MNGLPGKLGRELLLYKANYGIDRKSCHFLVQPPCETYAYFGDRAEWR
jgi:hypothetical protein